MDPAQSLFSAFVTALGDSEGGGALHQLHSPDAIVRHAQGLGPAAQIDRDEFARAHRETCVSGAASLPHFRTPLLLLRKGDVVWFELTEARGQQGLVAAVGLAALDGAPRIGWATLASQVEDWSYRDGLLRSLADYAWMRTPQAAQARALIDAAYFRLYRRDPVSFISLPDARFSCQMSTVCCKHDFEITLPPEAQLVIDAMPWETLRPPPSGTQLPRRPDGKLQLKSLSESCRFLGGAGQCLIHQTLGRQPFGPCNVFPVAFADTPDGIAVGLSPICASTRQGLGLPLSDREDDLRERLAHAQPRKPDGFRLSPGSAISWPHFRDIEQTLLDILAASDLPMRRRLHLGSRLLAAVRDQQPLDMKRWMAESAEPITPELRTAIHDMLKKVLGWDRAVLRELPRALPPALFECEVREAPVLARILRNTLFCKTYSYAFDLTTAHNFLIVLYLLTLIMQAAADGPLSSPMWRELGSLGVHGLLKSALHEGTPEGFRTVFGTAEFGLWMLSA